MLGDSDKAPITVCTYSATCDRARLDIDIQKSRILEPIRRQNDSGQLTQGDLGGRVGARRRGALLSVPQHLLRQSQPSRHLLAPVVAGPGRQAPEAYRPSPANGQVQAQAPGRARRGLEQEGVNVAETEPQEAAAPHGGRHWSACGGRQQASGGTRELGRTANG